MNEMMVFDRMLDDAVRELFCKRKGHFRNPEDEEYNALRAYILSNACTDDILRLKQGQFSMEPPKRFKIRKINSSARRICYSHLGKDKYLLQLMAYVLLDYDDIFADSLYSFRKNKDHRAFFEKLRDVDFQRHYYVLKMDVHAYGESIDQDILLDQLDAVFADDPEFTAFLHWFLKRNLYYENGQLHHERVSIVTGTPIGSFFNNLYLKDLDRVVEERARLYMRFSDDIAVFTETREEAEQIRGMILAEFEKLRLKCNPEKTAIYSPGEKFSVLGIEVADKRYDIAPESLGKTLFKIKKRQKRLLKLVWQKKLTTQEAFDMAMCFVNRYFYGKDNENNEMNWTAWAFGIITTTDTLKKVDHRTQEFLRSVKSGKSGRARYRTEYAELRKAGYRSLVHAYYHDHRAETNHP